MPLLKKPIKILLEEVKPCNQLEKMLEKNALKQIYWVSLKKGLEQIK